MTAAVYRGILLGTGANHLQQFYYNQTGGNVRIVWYFIQLGNTSPYECRMYVGTTTPPNTSALDGNNTSTDYTWGGDSNTIRFDGFGTGNFHSGKHIGIGGDGGNGAGGPTSGYFPTEMIIPNGDKMWLYVPKQIGQQEYEFAMRYNFVAIPE